MVTPAKDVPWNEVEDIIDLLRQWLVDRADVSKFDEVGAAERNPQPLDALVVAMETLRFLQILDGTQLPVDDAELSRAKAWAAGIDQRSSQGVDVASISEVVHILIELCMYNARGLRGPMLESTKAGHSERAKQLMYDDVDVRTAEQALYKIFPAIAFARKQVARAVGAERERFRAQPELRAELRPSSVTPDTSVPAPEWPPHMATQADDLLAQFDDLGAHLRAVAASFMNFFEPGRPAFPMTASGWQDLRLDAARRLERVGWRLARNGLNRSQSKTA